MLRLDWESLSEARPSEEEALGCAGAAIPPWTIKANFDMDMRNLRNKFARPIIKCQEDKNLDEICVILNCSK